MALSEEVMDEYKSSLRELSVNSKPLINMLTMLAEDHEQHAPEIVKVIEDHINKCKPDKKLPALYLMDSIMKNLEKSSYRSLFTKNIVQMFTSVFEQVDEKTRASMFKLRQTWSAIVANEKLYMIDVKIKNFLDPAWPITASAPKKTSIHVNPKFLHGQSSESERSSPEVTDEPAEVGDSEDQEVIMRQQLIAKQQELLRLQQVRLELELAEAEEKLKLQKKVGKAHSSSTARGLPFPPEIRDPLMDVPQAPKDPRHLPSDPRIRDPRLKHTEPLIPPVSPSGSIPIASQPLVPSVIPPGTFQSGLISPVGIPPSYTGAYGLSPNPVKQYNGLPMGALPYPGLPLPAQLQGVHHREVFSGEVFIQEADEARFSDENDSDSSRSSASSWGQRQPLNVRDPRFRGDVFTDVDQSQYRHSVDISKPICEPLPSVYGDNNQRIPDNHRSREREKSSNERESNSVKITSSRIQPHSPRKSLSVQNSSKGTSDMKPRENNRSDTKLKESFEAEHKVEEERKKKDPRNVSKDKGNNENKSKRKSGSNERSIEKSPKLSATKTSPHKGSGDKASKGDKQKGNKSEEKKDGDVIGIHMTKDNEKEVLPDKNVSMTKGLLKSSAEEIDIDDRTESHKVSEKRPLEDQESHRASKKMKMEPLQPEHGEGNILLESTDMKTDLPEQNEDLKGNIQNDISDLFGGEDEDLRADVRNTEQNTLALKSPGCKNWDQFKASQPEKYAYDIELKKHRKDLLLENKLHRAPEDDEDIDFRVGQPVFQRHMSAVDDVQIPQEHSLDQHSDILHQAHKQLNEGRLTHEQHQDLLKQLGQLVHIQNLQEANRRLSGEPVSDSNVQSGSNESQETSRDIRSLEEPLERFKIHKRNAVKKEDAGPVGHSELQNLYPDIQIHEHPNAHPFTSGPRLETFTPQLPCAEMFDPQLPRDDRFDLHVPRESRFGNLDEGHTFQDGPQGRRDPRMEVPLRQPLERIPADPGVSEVLSIFPGNRDAVPDHFLSPRDRDWRGSRDGRIGHFDEGLSRDEIIRHDADIRGLNRDIDTRVPAIDTNMTGQVWNADKLSQAGDVELRVHSRDIDTRGQIVQDAGMINSSSDTIAQDQVNDADMRGLTVERDLGAPNRDADMRGTFRNKEMLVPVKDANVPCTQGLLEEARDVRFSLPDIVMDRIGPEFRPGPPIRDMPPLVNPGHSSPGLCLDVQRNVEDEDFRKDGIDRRGHRSKGRFDDEREEKARLKRKGPHGKVLNRRGKYDNCDVTDNSWRKQLDSEREGPSPIYYDEQKGRRDRSRETKWPQDGFDRRSQDRRGPHERYRDLPPAERWQPEDRPPERPHWERRQQDENVSGRPPHNRRGHHRGHWRDQTRESWPDSQGGSSRDWDSRDAEGRSEMKIPPPTEYQDDNLQKKQWREYSDRDRNFSKQDGERQGRQREDGPEDVRYDRNHGLPAWETAEERDQGPPKRCPPLHDNRPLIPKEELEIKQAERLPSFLGPVNPNALEFRNEPAFNESSRPGGPTMPLPGQGGPHMLVPRGPTPHHPGFAPNMQRDLPPGEPVDQRGPQPGVETYIDKFGDPRFRCFADMGPLVNEEVVIGKRNYEIKLGAPPRRIQWANGFIEVFADPSKRGIMVDGVLLYKFGERVKEVNIRGKNEKIFYHGRPLNLWIDGQHYEVRVDSPPKTLIINGKPHKFQIDGRDMMILIDKHEKGVFGGEPRFVFIDEERMELRFDPPPRHILIDGELCELKLNTQQPCVNVKGRLCGIRFDGPPRDVFIDGIRYNIFTDHAVKLRVGNKFHYVALGGPCHEIIIDGKWFELKFNEPPKEINVSNQVLMIHLPGPPPEVKILPEIVQHPPHLFHMMPSQRLPVLPPPGMPSMFGVPVSIPQIINTHVRMNMPPNIMPSAVQVPVGPAIMPGIGLAPLFSGINNAPVLQTGNIPSVLSSLVSIPTPAPSVLSNLVSMPTLPAPSVPAQPIDIDSLLTNLVKSGIIKQKETEAKAEMNIPTSQPVATNPEIVHSSEYDNLDKKEIPQQEVQVFDDIQDMTEFDANEMKILPTGAIQRLYSGVQCTSCGQRFILDDTLKTERYRQHLDWHFRQNKRGKDDTKVMHCRKWYYGINDWIQYEDVVETDSTGKSSFFEQQQQQQTETGTPTTLQSPQISLPEGVLVVKCPPAAGNDNEDMCDICHEPFEQFWNEELEEWHLRDAIKVNNKTYHPICYEDYTDISEGTPSPSMLNVTEPAFSVKKSLTYEESSQDGMHGDHASFEEERQLPNHTLLLKIEHIKTESNEVQQSQPKSIMSRSQHFVTSTSIVKVESDSVCVKSEPDTDEVSVELDPRDETLVPCIIDCNYSGNKTDIKKEPVDIEMENERTDAAETTIQGDSNINVSLMEVDNESNIIQGHKHRHVDIANIDRTMEIDSKSVPVNISDNSVIILEPDVVSHDTCIENNAIPMEVVTIEQKITTPSELLLTHELLARESISPTSCTRLSHVKLVGKSEDIDINPEVLEIASNASTPTRDELPSPPGVDS